MQFCGEFKIHSLNHLKRAVAEWSQRLGEYSLDCLESYSWGYDEALCHLKQPPINVGYTSEQRNIWLQHIIQTTSKQQIRLNALNWLNFGPLAKLMSKSESEAFEVYFQLRERALKECPFIQMPATSPNTYTVSSSSECASSQSLNTLIAKICERPAMYLGNNASLMQVWAFLRGYFDAHIDTGVECLQSQRFERFQNWLDFRYPFGRTANWGKTLHIMGISSLEWSIESFTSHLQMFDKGERFDSQDSVMREMIHHMIEHGQRAEEE